jgi:hypothetical protein
MDEKWSFVGKKQENCDGDDPADQGRGDCWDHVAIDAEHRLVLCVLPGKRTGRPRVEKKVVPAALNYAVVHKHREDGRVVRVESEVVFGSEQSVAAALGQSTASSAVNTSFLERHNGTDRHRNARKARCTYCFSKDPKMHESMTYFTMYSYNFCWPVWTLAGKDGRGVKQPRTPAMAAGLTDHVWPMSEWVAYPASQ